MHPEQLANTEHRPWPGKLTENGLSVSHSNIHIMLPLYKSLLHPIKLANIPASRADQPRTLQKSSSDQAHNEVPQVPGDKWGTSCPDRRYHSS